MAAAKVVTQGGGRVKSQMFANEIPSLLQVLGTTGKFEVVLVDPEYVPKSRVKSPAYYLEILKVDTSPIVEHEIRKAAESAMFGKMPQLDFVQMASRVFNDLLVSG